MVRGDDVSAATVDDPCGRMDLSTSPLPLGPIGHVARARSVARRLLLDCGWDVGPAATLTTLLVTALCLHANAKTTDGVGLKDISELLRRLLAGYVFEELRESPMQFVGYATAELDALEAGQRRRLLQALLHALAGITLANGVRSGMTPRDKTAI